MASLLLSAASGVIFGSALTASGVYSPSIIISQLGLSNFHMLKSFLTASACSALIVVGANGSGYAKLAPRSDSSYGWFMKYDANVVGGLLQGLGMALTGACPGTVLVQLAMGVKSARMVAVGCILGGIAFVRLGQQLKRRQKPTDASRPSKLTLQEETGLSTTSIILIYEILCLAMIAAASILAPTRHHWLNPIVGGLFIGLAQTTSVLFTRKTLGVSSAWEDVGKYFWSVVDGKSGPSLSNLMFATGIMTGAKFISQYIPAATDNAAAISPAAALVGGFAMIFGARLAGGCTSGHGISGMATMGLSSFVTVASMFGGGIAATLLLQ